MDDLYDLHEIDGQFFSVSPEVRAESEEFGRRLMATFTQIDAQLTELAKKHGRIVTAACALMYSQARVEAADRGLLGDVSGEQFRLAVGATCESIAIPTGLTNPFPGTRKVIREACEDWGIDGVRKVPTADA